MGSQIWNDMIPSRSVHALEFLPTPTAALVWEKEEPGINWGLCLKFL